MNRGEKKQRVDVQAEKSEQCEAETTDASA